MIPAKYLQHFGDYKPVVFNGSEPIGWGRKPRGILDEEMFREIGKHGEWYCLGFTASPLSGPADWVLVERWLTPERTG